MPASSVNCLDAWDFFAIFAPKPLDMGLMRVPRPAAGMMTITFMAGCKYTSARVGVQIWQPKSGSQIWSSNHDGTEPRKATEKSTVASPVDGIARRLAKTCLVSSLAHRTWKQEWVPARLLRVSAEQRRIQAKPVGHRRHAHPTSQRSFFPQWFEAPK